MFIRLNLPYCKKCGAQIKEEDQFCPSCGEPVKAELETQGWKGRKPIREDELCFGAGERRRDPLGIVSFGVFLLVVGVVFYANPRFVSEFVSWVESMANQQVLRRPPASLISSAALFFGLIGASNFVTAGIRAAVDKVWRRVLSDLLSGVGLVSFAYLINQYGGHAISWMTVFGVEAIVVGALVVVYSMARKLF